MIDASEGYMKDGAKNRLRSMDLHEIVDAFIRQLDLPGYSRFVGNDEIVKNEYNLNIHYIDSSKTEDVQNIEGHLRGGIPESDVDALADYWKVCPTLRTALFSPTVMALSTSPSTRAKSRRASTSTLNSCNSRLT